MTIERRIRILDKIEFGQKFKTGEIVLLKGEGDNPVTLISGTVVNDDTLKVQTSKYDSSPGYHAPLGLPKQEYYSGADINEYNLRDLNFLPGITRRVIWKP